MSRLDELIAELCPDGVEYKKLEELFLTRNGYTPSKNNATYWTNGTVPWFRMEDIRENGHILSDSFQHVTKEAVKGELFPANSLIVATSATIGEHALVTVPSLANQRFTFLMLKDVWKSQFSIKFLYYYCYKLDKWCLDHLNQGNFASVDMKQFVSFRFPIPPLPVQQEIVRILDQFTKHTAELKAELTAELTARKKQYEYYRDSLLCSSGTTEYTVQDLINLGLIEEPMDGNHGELHPKKADYVESGIPFIMANNLINGSIDYENCAFITEKQASTLRKGFAKPGDVLLTHKGTIGRTAIVPETYSTIILTPQVTYYRIKKGIDNRYLKHYFDSTLFQEQIAAVSGLGGTRAYIGITAQHALKIKLPSIEKQREISCQLECFDELYGNLCSGLPAEIAARQKQYEYYRDKLLTFKELPNS